MKVVEEVPTRIGAGDKFFIHDFGVLGARWRASRPERLRIPGIRRPDRGLERRGRIRRSSTQLVITGGMTHRAVGILRAYRVYWRRLALSFTVGYLNDVLNAHPQLAADLIALFELRFDPDRIR